MTHQITPEALAKGLERMIGNPAVLIRHQGDGIQEWDEGTWRMSTWIQVATDLLEEAELDRSADGGRDE